jgi:redox-sensitive bicupin YhaK (pirin superfamily)
MTNSEITPQGTPPEKKGLSRRDLLAAAVPAGMALALGGKAMANPDGPEAGTASLAPLRKILGVYPPPPQHWVGNGFHVAGYMNVVPDALQRLDPFALLDYAATSTFAPTTGKRGVGPHPHRGLETVTFAFQGGVAHRDSTGAGGVIGPGDVQWMTAGNGILHREYHDAAFALHGGPFQMVQLWVNLPRDKKRAAPGYQPITASQIGVAKLPDAAGEARVVAGEHLGVKGPAKTFTPITILDLRLGAGKRHDLVLPAGHTVATLVMSGDVVLQGTRDAHANDFVLFGRLGERVSIQAKTPAQILVLSGAPIGEPVVQYGPFVMNSMDEIREAYADFEAGKFGWLDD